MSQDSKLVLYSYWRSSCSWRVRIALNLKNIDYEYRAVHLVQDGGMQLKDEYKAISPMCQVPSLVLPDGHVLTQSMAIIEYIEEAYQDETRLFPKDLRHRAKVRQICEMINSGTQPLQNLAVLKYYSPDGGERAKWANHWIENGLLAVEKVLADGRDGRYCVGDSLTAADAFLVPQVYNAKRFKVDMTQMPVIMEIMDNLEGLEPFKKAHPDVQPDGQSDKQNF